MECFLPFSVKAEEITNSCLGTASCLKFSNTPKKNPSNTPKKNPVLFSLPSYGTEVKSVNLFQTIQVRAHFPS